MQPHAPELEEAVIGACLIEQEALPLIADKLRPEMFYNDHHQLIFAALMAMYHAGKKIDILTVKEELARRGNLDAIGGPYAIVQLSSKVASSAHIEYHAQIIHQKYLAREMVVGFNKLLTCAMDETIDIDDTLIDAHNLLDRLEGESGHNAHIRDMETLMADTMEEAERRIAKSVNGVTGIPTGLTQNCKDLLSSPEVSNIFENSDFVYMLNQANGDRQILAKQLNISPHQLSYVTHSGSGEGLLFYGNTILPFVDHFPHDLELYKIMTTKLSEVTEETHE
mgnify:CR=1 FL=1